LVQVGGGPEKQPHIRERGSAAGRLEHASSQLHLTARTIRMSAARPTYIEAWMSARGGAAHLGEEPMVHKLPIIAVAGMLALFWERFHVRAQAHARELHGPTGRARLALREAAATAPA
jgi:hypothetical protein